MRRIIVGSFVTLDGVMQAAGGPEEGFPYGGWSAPYYDEALDKIVEDRKQPGVDILLGRKTFAMFAATPSGVIAVHYTRAGDVKTGTMGA